MKIYATPFNGLTLETTGASVDSGFTSIDQVVEMMGPDYVRQSPRLVIYGGVTEARIAYSDFVFRVDDIGNNG